MEAKPAKVCGAQEQGTGACRTPDMSPEDAFRNAKDAMSIIALCQMWHAACIAGVTATYNSQHTICRHSMQYMLSVEYLPLFHAGIGSINTVHVAWHCIALQHDMMPYHALPCPCPSLPWRCRCEAYAVHSMQTPLFGLPPTCYNTWPTHWTTPWC